jgi:hypothetical protein
MGSTESLNAGQRAVLQLLLRQGKSYDEIAGLLKSDAGAIRRRAHGAVGMLAPDDHDVPADHRNEIAYYLRGQQTAAQSAATREYLEASPAACGWARSVAGALAPLAGVNKLPDVPAEGDDEVGERLDVLEARTAREKEAERAATRGNWLISAGLGLLLALVIIAVVYFASSGGDDNAKSAASTTVTSDATATTGGTATVPGDAHILAQGTLRPPKGSGAKSSGQVAIVLFSSSNRYRLALTAKNLPPSTSSGATYGVWFYTSKNQAQFLGFPDKVVGADGKLDTVADLSPDTPNYKEVLLTSERSGAPKKPGTVVMRARLITATPAAAQGGATTPPAQTQTTP